MFDNLRDEVGANPYEEEAQYQPAAGTNPGMASRSRSKKFLGMTPQQRFILSVMILFATCVIGGLFLLVTGKIGF